MEFLSDGTGTWKQWDELGLLESIEDKFTYSVSESKIVFKYALCSNKYYVFDFIITNGYLILISDKETFYETMEAYTYQVSPETEKCLSVN